MKTILELFSSAWAQALGWTLLHTVWQAGIITLLVIAALRFIPSRLARARYVVATSALILMVLLSIGTFLFLATSTTQPDVSISQDISNEKSVAFIAISPLKPFESDYLVQIQRYLEAYIPVIIIAWIIGALLFSVRVAGGWFYIVRIKEESLELNDGWSERVAALARQLKIDRIVTLATSTRIQAPIVFGYFKPMILIPAGMLSGLSAEQLETIFIHELMHIRRHDYLINLVQLWIEAVLFFNPFAWILSGIIRREREYCCDDAVVTTYGNAMAYAKALAHLEEARLTHSGLALSLAENKNQLLTRIRRIMEKSVKNYSGRERIIPAVLLVIGLLCASWLTISSNRREINPVASSDEHLVSSDTTIKKERSARYSRKSVTTTDEQGEPLEKIEEDFEGDEELRPLMESRFDEGLATIPPIPDFEMDLAPLAMLDFHLDSIPPPPFPNAFDHQWEFAAGEFEKKFKEQFSDFYASHQKEFDKMMSDLEKEMKPNMDAEVWAKNFAYDMQRQEKFMQEHLKELHNHEEDIMRHREEAMRHQQRAMEELRHDQEARSKDMERIQKEQAETFKEMEKKMKAMEDNMKRFEKDFNDQLVRDGYIKAGEKINNIDWDEDGTIEVNGKKIKDSDKKKYEEIHKKYFKEDGGHFRYVE